MTYLLARMFSPGQKAIAVAVILLAAALRLRGVSEWSFNNDEIAEVRWSSRSFSGMMEDVRADAVHPPLDYMLQHVISRVRVPPWVPRVPPVLFGIGTVALAIFLGACWFSPAAGLIAGFLLAIAPNHVRYSQEVRPYSMGFFFIFAALAALEMYARSRRPRWAGIWFASVFLAGATLYFAGMIAALTSLTRILIGRKDELSVLWRRLPVIMLAWALLYTPWLRVVLNAVRSTPPQQPEKLTSYWWLYRMQVLGAGDWRNEPVSLGSIAFWLAVAIGLLVSIRSRLLLVATSWFLAGGALTLFVLHVHPHYSTPRYLLPAWLGAFLLAGSGITTLWRWIYARPLAAAIVIVFAGFAGLTLQTYYRGERADWRGIAMYVSERARPGETVIAANNWVVRNFGYYWQRLPHGDGVVVDRFMPDARDFVGPAWIVTGQCTPRQSLNGIGIMKRFPMAEMAEVRYVRPGQRLPMREELCPE